MEFLKHHAFMLVCLLAVLASAGLGFVGCGRMETIRTSMSQAADLGSQLNNAGTVPGRKEVVAYPDLAVQDDNIKKVQGQREKVRNEILNINRGADKLEYILEDAFSDRKDGSSLSAAIHYEFVKRYRDAVKQLPELLKAKGPPTAEDEARAKDSIDAENEQMGLPTEGKRSGAAPPATPTPAPTPARTARDRDRESGGALARVLKDRTDGRSPAPRLSDGRPSPSAAPAESGAAAPPLSPQELARTDPKLRAAIARAQETWCYVNSDDAANTFTVIAPALDVKNPPTPTEMWQAQLTLWIQREICQALARVNEQAAGALKAAGREVNVTTLPVKRLEQMLVGTYRFREGVGGDQPPGRGGPGGGQPPPRAEPRGGGGLTGLGASLNRPTPPPGPAAAETPKEGTSSLLAELNAASWTGRQGGPDLDVVPVGMRLILDLRGLPQVLDEICRRNFYVPLRVSYRRLERSELNGSFLYGPDPVVAVTLTFERYFFPEIYVERMPEEVRMRLGHKLPEEMPGGPRRTGAPVGGRPS